MNWLTLVALSAAGASGSSDVGDTSPGATVEAVASAEASEIVLEGVVVERADGGFLQIDMDGVNLVLRTYDADKKPVAVDADRASVRVQFASRSPEQYVLVKSDDGMSLTSGRPLRPPHVFRAYIHLFRGESDEAAESFQVAYP